MPVLSPTEKLKLGERYTFEFALTDFFAAPDWQLARQLNLAYAHVENAQVSRSAFSDKTQIAFVWRGPALPVSSVASSIQEVLSGHANLVFSQAYSGTPEQRQREEAAATGEPCAGLGPIDTIICKAQKAGETALAIVIGLVVLIVVAIVVIAFSPTGKEVGRRFPV